MKSFTEWVDWGVRNKWNARNTPALNCSQASTQRQRSANSPTRKDAKALWEKQVTGERLEVNRNVLGKSAAKPSPKMDTRCSEEVGILQYSLWSRWQVILFILKETIPDNPQACYTPPRNRLKFGTSQTTLYMRYATPFPRCKIPPQYAMKKNIIKFCNNPISWGIVQSVLEEMHRPL